MNRKATVQLVAAIVVLVFSGGIWITGGPLNAQWLRFYSAAVFLATLALTVWDRLLWRVPLAQRIESVPRNVRGTWKGRLTSAWIDPRTQQTVPEKAAYLVVRQTASEVSITLFTDEARSSSSIGTVSGENGSKSLEYMYLGSPDNAVQARSRIHHGSTSLRITGSPAYHLKGHYWTDRDSRGSLDFTERSNSLAEDFDSAAQLFA
jgi:hypothetical protein